MTEILHINPALGITRQGRRHLERLGDAADKAIQGDRHWFERHPGRQHRVRLASPAEVEQWALLKGIPLNPPPGSGYYVAVRKVHADYCLRCLFCSAAGNDIDVSEEEAAWVFQRFWGARAVLGERCA
jgi:hypothetical protein